MSCEPIAEMLASYAAGALTQEEYAMVDQHLETPCQECQLELAGLLSAASALAEGVSPVTPPKNLKSALMHQVKSSLINKEAIPADTPVDTSEDAPQVFSAIRSESSDSPRRYSYFAYAATALIALTIGSLASIGLQQGQVAKVLPVEQGNEEDYVEWGRQIEQTRQALGMSNARLVNVSTASDNPDWVSHLVYDELSKQLHLMIAGTMPSASDYVVWVWAKDTEGKLLSSGPVLPISSLYSASLLDLQNGPSLVSELVFTRENSAEPSTPSNQIIGNIKLIKE